MMLGFRLTGRKSQKSSSSSSSAHSSSSASGVASTSSIAGSVAPTGSSSNSKVPANSLTANVPASPSTAPATSAQGLPLQRSTPASADSVPLSGSRPASNLAAQAPPISPKPVSLSVAPAGQPPPSAARPDRDPQVIDADAFTEQSLANMAARLTLDDDEDNDPFKSNNSKSLASPPAVAHASDMESVIRAWHNLPNTQMHSPLGDQAPTPQHATFTGPSQSQQQRSVYSTPTTSQVQSPEYHHLHGPPSNLGSPQSHHLQNASQASFAPDARQASQMPASTSVAGAPQQQQMEAFPSLAPGLSSSRRSTINQSMPTSPHLGAYQQQHHHHGQVPPSAHGHYYPSHHPLTGPDVDSQPLLASPAESFELGSDDALLGYHHGQFLDLTRPMPRQQLPGTSSSSLQQHQHHGSAGPSGSTPPPPTHSQQQPQAQQQGHPNLVRSRSTPYLSRQVNLGMIPSAHSSSLRLSMTMDNETDYLAAAAEMEAEEAAAAHHHHQQQFQQHQGQQHGHYGGGGSGASVPSIYGPSSSSSRDAAQGGGMYQGHQPSGTLPPITGNRGSSFSSGPRFVDPMMGGGGNNPSDLPYYSGPPSNRSSMHMEHLEPFPSMSGGNPSSNQSPFYSTHPTPHHSPPTPLGARAPPSYEEMYLATPRGSPYDPGFGGLSPHGGAGGAYPYGLGNHHPFGGASGYAGGTGPHQYSVDPFGLGPSALRPRSFSATAAPLGYGKDQHASRASSPSASNRPFLPGMGMLPAAAASAVDLARSQQHHGHGGGGYHAQQQQHSQSLHGSPHASHLGPSMAHHPHPPPQQHHQPYRNLSMLNGPIPAAPMSLPVGSPVPQHLQHHNSQQPQSIGPNATANVAAAAVAAAVVAAKDASVPVSAASTFQFAVPTMPPTLLPSLQAMSGWAASRIHLHTLKMASQYPMYLSILGGDHVDFQFGFPVAVNVNGVGSPTTVPAGTGSMSGAPSPTVPSPNKSVSHPQQQQQQQQAGSQGGMAPSAATMASASQGQSVAFVLVEQVSLVPKANELHVPTCTNAPNHLLSWTTVYAANSFGIYRLTPLQSHVLPLFVRPLVQYSERIINKEKMPHLALAVGEGGTGKTWSYLLGCIDYIVRGSHFQRGGLVSGGSQQQQHHAQHAYHPQQQQHGGAYYQQGWGGAPAGPYGPPMTLQEQHQMLLNGGGSGRGMQQHQSQHHLGSGPKAIILLPTKEAVMKMKKLLGDLASAITNSWLKSQDIIGTNHRQRPQRLVSYLAIVGNILKARLAKQLNDHDIIVATPSSLAELVETRNLRLDSVKYLIVDEITRVHEHASVQQLTNDVCTIVSHLPVSTKSHSIKIVLFSRHWNTNVQYLTERIAAVFQVVPPTAPQHSSSPMLIPPSLAAAAAAAAGVPLSPVPGSSMASSSSSSSSFASGSHSGQGGSTGEPNSPPQPAPCESYLKIVVCPKAFPHTIFPRPCLIPFAHHVLRPLAHIPHHFVAVDPTLPSARFDVLLAVVQGKQQYDPPVVPLPPPLGAGSHHERAGTPTSPQHPSSGSGSNGSSTPPLSAATSPQVQGSISHHHHARPRGFIVMTNSRQGAVDLHAQLQQSPVGSVSHLVMPETLETTLSTVRSMGLHARINAFHQWQKTIGGNSSTRPGSTTPPMSTPASPAIGALNDARAASSVLSMPGSPSVGVGSPSVGGNNAETPEPQQPIAFDVNEPFLILITVRPDAQSGSWMLDLKAISQDLTYTMVNYACPLTIDDYYLSLLTHVSPNVSHGVDGAVKMTLAPNRVPLRTLPQALVTLYSADAPPANASAGMGSGAPTGSGSGATSALGLTPVPSQDAFAGAGEGSTTTGFEFVGPVTGPMAVGEYMPTTETDRVALFRSVASAIAQSRPGVTVAVS